MPELFDPYLVKTFKEDKKFLETSKVPIITVSASYKEDLKKSHGFPDDDTIEDVVFSRAHYSMALGVAIQIWGKKIDPKKAWIVDPTNYVSHKNWNSIELTEIIGKTIARHPILKTIKDLIDTFGRGKMPILKSITPPLLHLTESIHHPILSFHIAAGNILAGQGKKILQVITDPHVRDEFVKYADQKNIKFCVFNEDTKIEFLEKAAEHDVKADSNRIIITGPPIDPRVIATKERKHPWRNGPINLCLATGGLGTNKNEIEAILEQVLPELRKNNKYKLLIYAGTHQDINLLIKELAKKHKVKISKLNEKTAKLRIIYHPQLVDANELLIKYAFPWADGFLTKPSGDMAYDAATSGSFLLTLAEWGEWEEKIREVFEQKDIARKAMIDDIVAQLEILSSTKGKSQSWIEKAMHNAHTIDPFFLNGSKEIAKAIKEF
ncbi:MAG: hypothetical protein GW942_02010 [Candidatus Pacebacteria bacterium]|nr:hypothetical protein [Candidatus Paceibacterota bacterium]PIQ81436.1 MAG: hypothetical protein COV78_00195 [Candidatus Pacebacteria bacterium CG11_big_fil_rev_8_21_14_0_20_34_55]PIX81745.1 MAG: hypothetical protein COZ34_01630 [Candidatus Pacebacteria bacterium CG_4_10_14_3_um_filter_34_15]PJC43686.1 MAG: hypothetical protein CO039_02720 [Candidatus Pacebacteria bacterium CG_4_9_14_0_2_um_filter_34_50]